MGAVCDRKACTITTYPSKVTFDFKDIRPEMIYIKDIAWSLSLKVRYSGFVPRLYTVGEHCIRGAEQLHGMNRFNFLMHDAAEAYVSDIVTPLKSRTCWLARDVQEIGGVIQGELEFMSQLESRIADVIRFKYGAPHLSDPTVHAMDAMMFATERHTLFGMSKEDVVARCGVPPLDIDLAANAMSSDEVYERFLHMFDECIHKEKR